jgi:multidrug transporter EmrE-like cation transporter
MLALLLIAVNATANTAGHICFKLSSAADNTSSSFIFWQIVGNTAAFVGVLAYTGLMRDMSLLMAFPLTQGLTAIGVQVVASLFFFHEQISPLAWAATVLIAAGIIVMNRPAPGETKKGAEVRVQGSGSGTPD